MNETVQEKLQRLKRDWMNAEFWFTEAAGDCVVAAAIYRDHIEYRKQLDERLKEALDQRNQAIEAFTQAIKESDRLYTRVQA